MNFQTAVKTCLTQKYATFQGRARRSEYWWFVLAYVIGAVIVSLLGLRLLSIAYALALFLPLAAAGYRRLQDTGRPGWYIFIPMGVSLLTTFLAPAPVEMTAGQVPDMGGFGLFALLGFVQIVLFVLFIWWLTRPSEAGTNAYGPPPADEG